MLCLYVNDVIIGSMILHLETPTNVLCM